MTTSLGKTKPPRFKRGLWSVGAGPKGRAHLDFSRRTGDPADTAQSRRSVRRPRGQRSAAGRSGRTARPRCGPPAADLPTHTSGTEARGEVLYVSLALGSRPRRAACRTFRSCSSSARSPSAEPRSSTSRHLLWEPPWKRTRVPGRGGAELRNSRLWLAWKGAP